ncbi:MAG: di-trans,poly-cis-decaprenylcistransferase [Candidatus Dactylopiibacterium carminicum]|uniref:Isoprenyl transferase n=1 Tax=Candidatus Dactylopiibacterium carminicum TaxID=857335 RepID=A0A272EQE7_9RHOO|nr:polyprenyl diphosphate synthase [Candidatus Dactylopiibacterium carminicum]KAF7598544.1 di-trans,poly-cis-decaprenylcistransferase [Candidatus Dactylopiibacterium carminicum]PAS92325.1 MAG: di-trans,poly-cis-decaprenylcistransferase [Candidatus Dactylopiibacterium carminicum]PAS98104.1 MAG: di-trans,poly-cis-decaprenylcistransferase [Candidatus Dactylopiibacterium carminicum]
MFSRLISSTRGIPEHAAVPQHIAIVMDGNGRWARKRLLPRVAGHKRGLETVRRVVQLCVEHGVSHLTLFAFSSENWRRPADEVSFLMQLFMQALRDEVEKLHRHNIRLRVIGDLSRFDPKLVETIRAAESLTTANTALTLSIAANYGGRWDILNAVNRMLNEHPDRRGDFTEEDLAPFLSLADASEPDLYIRTGGEQRVSNFLLWQLAYTEFYFTDCLWPDFDTAAFDQALASYRARERRFGRTSEQLQPSNPAVNRDS